MTNYWCSLLLLCSPNFPRASISWFAHAKHETILKNITAVSFVISARTITHMSLIGWTVFIADIIIFFTHAYFMTYLISLTLYSNEHIMDFDGNTIICTASVTSLIVSADDHRKGDMTVTRESCPCDVWRWIAISCTVKHYLLTLICCLIVRYLCDGGRT